MTQATTLTLAIVATQIGMASGQISHTMGAALLAAGLTPAAIFSAAVQLLSPASSAGARSRTAAAPPDRRGPGELKCAPEQAADETEFPAPPGQFSVLNSSERTMVLAARTCRA